MNAAASRVESLTSHSHQQFSRRDELILEHMPLVSAIAGHVQRSLPVHIELDDLIHAGLVGLFEAAVKYEADKKVPFSTYAKHRIRGAILDSLRQLDWASRDLRKRYRQMEAVKAELATKLQCDPSEEEIAAAMGLNAKRWRALMVDFRRIKIMAAQTRSDREEQSNMELPSAPAHSPDQALVRSEMRTKLWSAMSTLPSRYRRVVELYYQKEMTMKEIGNVLGVNESRVSQIHKSALQRLQAALDGRGIHSAAAF